MTAGFLLGRYVNLAVVIQLLVTSGLLVGSMSQTIALFVLRRRQPQLDRPYRMWLYPLPAVVVLVTAAFMFVGSDFSTPGVHPTEWSLTWILAGCLAFLAWSRKEQVWPFGPNHIEEQYLRRQESSSE